MFHSFSHGVSMAFPWSFHGFSHGFPPSKPLQSPPRRPRSCPWAPEWIGPLMPERTSPGDLFRWKNIGDFLGFHHGKIGKMFVFFMENWKNWKNWENWIVFWTFYHGKLETIGKFWGILPWQIGKIGTFWRILPWKIGKIGKFWRIFSWKIGNNWENLRLFCRIFSEKPYGKMGNFRIWTWKMREIEEYFSMEINEFTSNLNIHGSLNVPIVHITQPLGIWWYMVY